VIAWRATSRGAIWTDAAPWGGDAGEDVVTLAGAAAYQGWLWAALLLGSGIAVETGGGAACPGLTSRVVCWTVTAGELIIQAGNFDGAALTRSRAEGQLKGSAKQAFSSASAKRRQSPPIALILPSSLEDRGFSKSLLMKMRFSSWNSFQRSGCSANASSER